MAVKFAPAPKEFRPVHKQSIADLARREEIAQALLNRGRSAAPIQHWTQGAAKMVQGLTGALRQRQINNERAALKQQSIDHQNEANDIWGALIPKSVPPQGSGTPPGGDMVTSPPMDPSGGQLPPVDPNDAAQLSAMLNMEQPPQEQIQTPRPQQTALNQTPRPPATYQTPRPTTPIGAPAEAQLPPVEVQQSQAPGVQLNNDPPGQWKHVNGDWQFNDARPVGAPQEIAATAAPAALNGEVLPPEQPTGKPPSFLGQRGPASIRYNNPGAQYPGPTSKKYGSDGYDIIGGGHKIARFPDAVSGAAAQFDLLHRKYGNRTLADGIREWSGGNHVGSYLNVIRRETGLKPNTYITKEMLQDPKFAIPLAKAMSIHEAGKAYPLSDQHWAMAHGRFMNGGKVPAGTIQPAQMAGTNGRQPLPGQPQQVADASGKIGGGPVMTRQLLRRMLKNPHTRAQAQKYISERSLGGGGGKSAKYGKTGAVYRDQNGQLRAIQFGDDGSLKKHELGGMNKDRGVGKIDTGTGWQFYDKSTGQMVNGGVDKNLSGVEQQKARGQAIAAMPKARESAFKIFSQVDSILLDPNLDSMVGPIQGRLYNYSGDANTWESKIKQIGGSAFLEAFQQLKGGGHITEIEGEKATQAIVRMNEKQNENDFRRGLLELKEIARRGLVRAHVEAGMQPPARYLKPFVRFPNDVNYPQQPLGGMQAPPATQQLNQAPPQLPEGWKIKQVR